MDARIPKRIAVVGNPNSGKTTLFNALTGRHQIVGNYPGVTVDKVEGVVKLPKGKDSEEQTVRLIDLPGTYSLDPISPDEQVTKDVLEGTMKGVEPADAVIIVADATSLQRAMSFIGDVLQTVYKQNVPAILVLTMIDELKARGGAVKIARLKHELGVPVIGIVGNKGIGIDDLKAAIADVNTWAQVPEPIPSEVEERFKWADKVLEKSVTQPKQRSKLTEMLDRIVLNPVIGLFLFVLVMFTFFQIIFIVGGPIKDFMADNIGELGSYVKELAFLPPMLQSLIGDGIIAGVGGVVSFLPLIAILLALIAILEGSGYLVRAAFLIDRVMGWAGLEGRSFVALLSSYACAIPGIMATRSIPDPKSRIATMMAAPLMTCSARLPIYALLIGAFIPEEKVLGIFSLQGTILFGLYFLGSISALIAGWVFKNGVLRGQTYPFYMELPPYRIPSLKVVLHRVWQGVYAFIKKAGTIILVAMVIIWAALHFPSVDVPSNITDEAEIRAYELDHSFAADVGHVIEPVIAPLGFDWQIGIGILASFSAREIIIGTLAQIYAYQGDEEDINALGHAMDKAKMPDGSKVYTIPTVIALLVFYVFAMQCISTLATIKRETNTWKWPAVAFIYMTILAWVAAYGARILTEIIQGTA